MNTHKPSMTNINTLARVLREYYYYYWAPQLKNALDSSNFDNWDHMAKEVDPREKKLTSKEQDQFKGF